MSEAQPGFTKLGFMKTFVLPALLVFLIPLLSLLFFRHAVQTLDDEARVSFLAGIRADKEIPEERRKELTEFFTEVPASKLVTEPDFEELFTNEVMMYYTQFRWMIRISGIAIASGVSVFLLGGVSVLWSMRSHYAQYLNLSLGWHVLRVFSALQVIAQGVLLVALSFWVTALWAEVYIVRLILLAAFFALIAVVAVVRGIFKKVDQEFSVEGEVITPDSNPGLWNELRGICNKVGTEPPDQVIVGIDDNFFVTEQPLKVGDHECTGRTLFVSLSLLKQFGGGEADAVLAHEMAHFSGNDTLYSSKISPLLSRYDAYLQSLSAGGLTLPVFYFMHCFRAMYELSLGRLSRQREFRADRIAAETTSNRDLAGSLLRIVAYAHYRGKVQSELFEQEEVLESANVCERIEDGFQAYRAEFLDDPDLGSLTQAHPFDSHPPLRERLSAVGLELDSPEARGLVTEAGDGRWFSLVDGAEAMERAQWDEFEQKFRDFHEEHLSWRYLPETDAQREVVEKFFPKVTFEGTRGKLTLDHTQIHDERWSGAIPYERIINCSLNEGELTIDHRREGKKEKPITLSSFGDQQQEVLSAIERYYSRHLAAIQYQKELREKQAGKEGAESSS